jgi:hypothetical protein
MTLFGKLAARLSPALLPVTLLLAACSGSDPAPETQASDEPSPAASPGPSDTATPALDAPPRGYTDGSGINEGYPRLRPPLLTPEAERGETGARNVLVSFARAIELREYDQAWAMLGIAARQNWTRQQFNAAFAGLDQITVAVPDGEMEGAAGSSYYNAAVTVTATDADGRPVRIEGPITLRRVNDADGATPQQLRWHIESLRLDVTH